MSTRITWSHKLRKKYQEAHDKDYALLAVGVEDRELNIKDEFIFPKQQARLFIMLAMSLTKGCTLEEALVDACLDADIQLNLPLLQEHLQAAQVPRAESLSKQESSENR